METILKRFASGEIGIEEACKELKQESIRRLKDFARIDVNRQYRTGIPEIIFAEGKNSAEVADIAIALATAKGFALISRARGTDAGAIKKRLEEQEQDGAFEIDYNEVAKTIRMQKRGYLGPGRNSFFIALACSYCVFPFIA